jgi:hypothetical protein
MTIRNAQHARLRTVAPTTNYATATETVWDGNSPCSASGEQAFLSAHVVGSAFSAAAPNGLILSMRSCSSHVCVPLLP